MYTKKSKSYSKAKKKKTYTDLERMAYNYGKIQRGINNPNSRVYESYNNGRNGKSTKNKKPLI